MHSYRRTPLRWSVCNLPARDFYLDGWQSIIGYQTQPWSIIGKHGGCPGRSPSMWVDGGCHGDQSRKDRAKKPCPAKGGLHYWTCDIATNKPVAGAQRHHRMCLPLVSRTEQRFCVYLSGAGVVPSVFRSTNEWVHIAWVKRGSVFEFYRNGKLLRKVPTSIGYRALPWMQGRGKHACSGLTVGPLTGRSGL